mmetsp:Transcript_4901/g.4289  ORF Transcript_4901/g.4289 Transcript_4901/m.4289 type:complete len:163 (-) Transcript_4901:269-757(-)
MSGLEKGAATSLLVCCTVCCLAIGNAVNICAIVFAFEEYSRDGCTDVCDTNCNPDQFMDVTLFLQIVGFTMMGLSIVSVCSHFLICPPPDPDQPNIPSVPQLIFNVIIIIYYFAWVIVGFVLRDQLSDKCKDTDKGKMFFAWCIIYAISASGSCYNISKQIK